MCACVCETDCPRIYQCHKHFKKGNHKKLKCRAQVLKKVFRKC